MDWENFIMSKKYCPHCGSGMDTTAEFCPACGGSQPVVEQSAPPSTGPTQQVQVVVTTPQPTPVPQPVMRYPIAKPTKSKTTAALLAFFLGGLGAHKFYLGKTAQGVLYLLFCWTFIPSIVAFIEFLIYITTSDADFARKYEGIEIEA